LFSLGLDAKPRAFIAENRHQRNCHGNAQAIDRLCGKHRSPASSPWAVISEPLQVHFVCGNSFERLLKRVAKLFEIFPKALLSGGKKTKTVTVRSVVSYWGNRELGMSTIELSKKMNISQPTVSQSVVRGQKIARKEKLAFLE
jgi:hypothetical protein